MSAMQKLLRKQLVQRNPQAQSRQAQRREFMLHWGRPRMASSTQMQGTQRKLRYCTEMLSKVVPRLRELSPSSRTEGQLDSHNIGTNI